MAIEYLEHRDWMPERMANLYLKDKFNFGFFKDDIEEAKQLYDVIYIHSDIGRSWNKCAEIVAKKYNFNYMVVDDMTCVIGFRKEK